MRSSACRVGAVTQTTARITFVSKSTTAPVVTCSGGTVSVLNALSDRYNTGGNSIATVTYEITGLSGFADYTYTITQDSDVINGSFKTMPDKTQPFSYIVASCDNPKTNYAQRPYKLIRELMNETDAPLVAMFHIDDISYVDTVNCVDNDTTISTTGEPQTTGLARDYAVGWAHSYGLVAGGGSNHACEKTKDPDRHYVFQNLPSFQSGGDHAIEGNHCRGALSNGVPNTDYHGCDRTGGGLEEVAKAEFDAFIGNGNPDPLRADKWHWGAEIGCMKFAVYDYSLYSDPYDSVLNTDPDGYGTEQIGDINTYLTTGDYDFKCLLMESPVATYGQPWKNWHETEAGNWKTAFDAEDKLNGVDASTFIVCGDNHALYNLKFDTFWNFCAGCFNGTPVVNAAQETSGNISNLNSHWSGQNQFSQHAYNSTGDRLLGGFWQFKVYPGDRVEAICWNATGVRYPETWTLSFGATNNQWTRTRAKFA